jgi:hypothetical protein
MSTDYSFLEGLTRVSRSVGPRRALLALCAIVLPAAACGSSTPPAAVVDGTTISQQTVVDELEAIQGNERYVAAFEEQGASVLGEEDGTFDSAFVASQLAIRIQYTIVANEVEERGIEVDGACRDAARDQVERRFVTPAGEEVFGDFTEAYQDYLVKREADVIALQGDLVDQPCVSEDAVADYYESHQDELEQACASVVADLAGGADFATLAAERSQDPGSAEQGGDLGCLGRGETVEEFDAAAFSQPIGEVGAPVQTSFGYHVILVTSRGTPTLDEARDQIAQRLQEEVEAAFQQWFLDALAAADVTVDSRYGTWNATDATIDRLETEAPTSTTADPAAGG